MSICARGGIVGLRVAINVEIFTAVRLGCHRMDQDHVVRSRGGL